jgi:uridylate kinase
VPDARRFSRLSYMDALNRRLEVMDSTALALCMENDLPVVVFDVGDPAGILSAAQGAEIGTRVSSTASVLEAAGS